MINFDGVNFSERHSEEVICFFWRSVYYDFDWNKILFFNKTQFQSAEIVPVV